MRHLLLLLLMTPALSASATPTPTPTTRGLVYVVTDDGMAYGYRVLPNGALAPLPLPPTMIKPAVRAPLPDFPDQAPDTYNQQGWSSAADPQHSLLYVTGYHASMNMYPQTDHESTGQAWGALQVYRVSQDGRLTPVYKKPWSFPEALGSITIDPTGRFVWIDCDDAQSEGSGLYVHGGGGGVIVFTYEPCGMVRKIRRTSMIGTFASILPSGNTDDSGTVVSTDGKNAYSYYNTGFVDHHEYAIGIYRILPNGRLRLLGEVDSRGAAATVMSFALDSANRVLYVADDEYSSGEAASEETGIALYSLHENHLRSLRSRVPYPKRQDEQCPITILTDPSGRFIFASNAYSIEVYAINSDGTLTLRSRNPGLDLKAVSHDGRVLYALTTLGEKSFARSALVPVQANPDGSLNRLMPVLLPKDASVRQVLVY